MSLLCSGTAFAANGLVHEGQDFRVRKLHIDLVVNPDGTYTETTDVVEQLNSSRAVEQGGQLRIPYSSSLDSLEILEASTLKQDGRRLPVPRTSIFTQDGLISPEGLTSFQDLKTTIAVFPTLEAGDSIELRTRLTRRKSMLPGVFSYTRTFAGDIQNDDAIITLTAPQGYPLHIDNPGVGVSSAVLPGGLQKWTWTYRNGQVDWPEAGTIDPINYRPRILVSSLNSYEDLANAANGQFDGKAAVTPAVRSAALAITNGTSDPREQARRILEWVARNIRYFAIVLDVGGYIPRTADEVLSSRFGDCKDHTVVVQALLAAVGIPSQPAILSTDAIYQLPRIPVLSAFNHAIVFVPGLKVFLDTNTPSVALGSLPEVDADKPVLLLGAAQPLARTPALTADTNGTRLNTRIRISADGSATGQDTLTASGGLGIAYESLADAMLGTDPIRIAKSILLQTGFVGEGTATARRISTDADFRFELLYDLKDFAPLDQAGGVKAVAPMEFLGAVARADVASVANRTVPYLCSARTDAEDFDIVFPASVTLAVPRGVAASGPARSYESSYSISGNTVHVRRTYVSHVPHGVCDPGEFPQLRQLQETILRDLHREIRYAPATSAPAGRPAGT